MHIYYMADMDTLVHTWSCYFGTAYPGYHYYEISLSAQCSWEEKILKGMMHFHHMTNMATPYHKNPYPRCHTTYNFVRAFPGHHYYTVSLSALCPGVEKICEKKWPHLIREISSKGWPKTCDLHSRLGVLQVCWIVSVSWEISTERWTNKVGLHLVTRQRWKIGISREVENWS